MKIYALFILLTSFGVIAETPSKYAVETIDQVPTKLKEKYPEAIFKTPQDLPPSDLKPLDERNRDFEKLGLKDEILKMDEADKDVLHWRLKHASIEKLKKWYPLFPATVWSKLQTEGKR